MATKIYSKISIPASAEMVWKVLTDTEKYPEWNPLIQSLEGELKEGNKLKARINGMKFKPKVLDFKQNKLFRWKGRFLIPGLFDGEHSFEIEEVSENRCVLHHYENFSGILVPFMRKKLKNEVEPLFEQFNEKLEEKVESLLHASLSNIA
jgi:hypothetical protein